jgi:hypothetical protein
MTILVLWSNSDVPGLLSYMLDVCAKDAAHTRLSFFDYMLFLILSSALYLRNSNPNRALEDSESEHNFAVLAVARFKLKELGAAHIKMGKYRYQMLRRLGKHHQI